MAKTEFDLEREAKLNAISMIHNLKLGINWIITYKKENTTILEASVYLGNKLNKFYVPFRLKVDNLKKSNYKEAIANELKSKIADLVDAKVENVKAFSIAYLDLTDRLEEQEKALKD